MSTLDWRCARCREPLGDVVYDCESCDDMVCHACFDAQESACTRCAEVRYCSEDDVLEQIQRVGGQNAVEMALALRTKALIDGETRVPLASWYHNRVKDLLADLIRSGFVVCSWEYCLSHRERRESMSIGVLCEWALGDKGREYLSHPVSA